MNAKTPAPSKQKIARIMARNVEQALLTATEEGTTRERGFALWRVSQLLRSISELGLKYPSGDQTQTA